MIYLAIVYRMPPWIALSLALTFGVYGLLKKVAPLDALQGLSFETCVLALPALAQDAYVIGVTGARIVGSSGSTASAPSGVPMSS